MLCDSARHLIRLVGAVATGGFLSMTIATTAGQDRSSLRGLDRSEPKPDYERVFAMNRVHEVRIAIPAERFRQMQSNLETLARGRGGPFGRGPLPGLSPNGLAMAAALQDAARAGGPPAGRAARGGGGPFFNAPDPIAVSVSVQASGRTWTRVRMRYKGNSSLMAAVGGANGKVPFRLEFGSDDAPSTERTFYGFRKLTFSSNFADDSQLREVLASEVLRDRGVPAARAAFYRVFVDAGEGATYWGLYTMIEDPDDGAMLDAQLSGRTANLYKPDGPAANWTRFEAASFEKKTNRREANFGDVIAAIDALHDDMSDRALWRARFERVFDVDLFLRWLAVNTVIDNWDAYGAMAHNYYLYGDPTRGGRLQWIPWDHNMAFGAGPGGGRGFPGGAAGGRGPRFGGPGMPGPFGRGSRDVLHRDASDAWPLISRLLSLPEYAARYRSFLTHGLGGLMEPDAVGARVRALHALIAPAVVGTTGERETHTTVSSEASFLESPERLLEQIALQRGRIRAALAEVAP
jgi:spore coat protein H